MAINMETCNCLHMISANCCLVRRCYASVVISMDMTLSDCLSQAGIALKWLNGSSIDISLSLLTNTTLCWMGIKVFPK